MKCEHPNTRFVETPELTHHGKDTCVDCGAFVRWVPKPANVTRDAENMRVIHELWKKPLTAWEKEFCMTLERKGRGFSPKQLVILEKLKSAYGV